MSCVLLPWKETAGRTSGKPCLWHKFIISFLQRCVTSQKTAAKETMLLIAGNVVWLQPTQFHITRAARNICSFVILFFEILFFQHILFHIWNFCRRALYYMDNVFQSVCFLSRSALFDCSLAKWSSISNMTCWFAWFLLSSWYPETCPVNFLDPVTCSWKQNTSWPSSNFSNNSCH